LITWEALRDGDTNGALAAEGGRCPAHDVYDPLDPEQLRDPFRGYKRAQLQAPVFYSERHGFWLITRREDVVAALHDTKTFSNREALAMPLPPEEIRDRMPRYPFATGLLFLDEPEHRPARKMVQAPFTRGRVRAVEPVMRARAEQLLRPADPDRRIEFVHEYGLPLALFVIGSILGVPEEDFPLLRRAVVDAFKIVSGTATQAEILELAEGQLSYWGFLCALVDERRARPQDDFISVLAAYRHEDGAIPTTDQVAVHVNTILGAGFETSAQMMAVGVASILSHREQWELLKSDRSLIERAVEECVRYRTISKRNFRITTTDVDVAGVRIPAGALVSLEAAAANRDESEFLDAERFDITRRADNLTFGRGIHFCLGAPLSKLEMRVTLETLLDLAPDVRLGEGLIEYEMSVLIDSIHELPLDLGPVPGVSRPG
jgi:cytochrome P450